MRTVRRFNSVSNLPIMAVIISTLFGMTVEEFYSLPTWKKKKLKQDAGLF